MISYDHLLLLIFNFFNIDTLMLPNLLYFLQKEAFPIDMDQLKSKISQLTENEAKTLLLLTFLNEEMLDEKEFSQYVQNVYREVMADRTETSHNYSKAHIVFGDSASGSLKYMLKQTKREDTEQVLTFADDYSYGPIWKLHTKAGQEIRSHWLHTCTRDELRHPLEAVTRAFKQMDEHMPIYIWTTDHAPDRIGLLLAIYLLKKHTNDMYVIHADAAYRKLNEYKKVTYDYITTGNITPENAQKIVNMPDYIKKLSVDQRKEYEKQWIECAKTSENLHVFHDGSIHSIPENSIDSLILEKAQILATKNYIPSARLIGEVLGHNDFPISDSFIEYRLRALIGQGYFEVKGHTTAMRYYQIRFKKNKITSE